MENIAGERSPTLQFYLSLKMSFVENIKYKFSFDLVSPLQLFSSLRVRNYIGPKRVLLRVEVLLSFN